MDLEDIKRLEAFEMWIWRRTSAGQNIRQMKRSIGNDWRRKIPHTQNKNQTKDVDWTHS